MRRHLLAALLIVGFATGLTAATSPDERSPTCAMSPAHERIPVPSSGLAWVEGDDRSGPCEEDHTREWTSALSGAFLVDAQFGIGSARPWVVTVKLRSKSGEEPDRGFCLDTITLGWRTLDHYWRTPLPWVLDLDADKASELLIWESFPLKEQASMAEYGLIAWVYKLGADETFIVDWGLSRKMAAELATAYRSPMPENERCADDAREMASRELDDFAQERCRVAPTPAPEPSDEPDEALTEDFDEEP